MYLKNKKFINVKKAIDIKFSKLPAIKIKFK